MTHSLWRVLQARADPSSVEGLALRAGITEGPGSQVTISQARSTRAGLEALAAAGLARCTADGQWVARAELTDEQRHISAGEHERLAARVRAERRQWRAGTGTEWFRQRAAALRACRARAGAWWQGLDAVERAARRRDWQHRYAELAPIDQEQLKRDLAERRIRAGQDETTRHARWINAQHPDAYDRRCAERAAWYHRLAPPLQQAYAAAWQRHRDHYGIPRGTPTTTLAHQHAQALPHGLHEPDAAYLYTLTEQLTLPQTVGDAAG